MNNWKKKFIIIWTGQLFSILSSSIAQFSIVLWISLKTGSAEVLSFATIAALLPQALLGPFAGVFVDRWNRKWTMIGADSFVALCSGVIALLFYLDIIELWHIYLLLMLRSVGRCISYACHEILCTIVGTGKRTYAHCGYQSSYPVDL